jgi:4-hydroxy-tetrahydrodipicolinate synthase
LGTEVSKLTFEERQEVLEVVAKRIDGRKPLLVTIYGDTITEQIEFSKLAIQNGASALLLQPPSHKMDHNITHHKR